MRVASVVLSWIQTSDCCRQKSVVCYSQMGWFFCPVIFSADKFFFKRKWKYFCWRQNPVLWLTEKLFTKCRWIQWMRMLSFSCMNSRQLCGIWLTKVIKTEMKNKENIRNCWICHLLLHVLQKLSDKNRLSELKNMPNFLKWLLLANVVGQQKSPSVFGFTLSNKEHNA